jgi:hypothetical protein
MRIPRFSHPLPVAHESSAERMLASHRRHHAGGINLDPVRLLQFNERIGRLLGQQAELDSDGLSTVARMLLHAGQARRHPACVAERLRCAAAMEMMLQDPAWQPDEPTGRVCSDVVDYLRSSALQLIPNAEPVVGRLDDAILVECAWPFAEGEVLLYCDFRRLRQIEAELRGVSVRKLQFRRADFFEARQAEARLYAFERQIGLGNYAPRPRDPQGPLLFCR